MTSNLLLASIDYATSAGQIGEAGDPCDYCGGEHVVEATVEIEIEGRPVDGGLGLRSVDRATCLHCVWSVIRDEHAGDGAPRVLLHPGVPVPPGVHDPSGPAS